MILKDKMSNSVVSLKKGPKEPKRERGKGFFDVVADFAIFRERIYDFSPKYWAIRPSEVFGARRKMLYAERPTRGHQF